VDRWYRESTPQHDRVEEAYAAARADERARGMRRAARYAARWHAAEAASLEEVCGSEASKSHEKAAIKCERLSRGKPAFTTPRAFGREP
jgi:phosphopantetheinyl transferase